MASLFEEYEASDIRRGMALAVEEGARIGREGLRKKYGFRPSAKFVTVAAGHHFDSKALVSAAAAHLDPPRNLTSANSWGGPNTTRVLDLCGIPWIDTESLAGLKGLEVAPNPSLDDPARPKYWWVNQSENYTNVIEDGSLWAPHVRSDGRRGHADWQALHYMEPGDMVFHYAGKKFRALSRVVSRGVEAQRPPGYTGDRDGTLVLVAPLVVDMEVEIENLTPIFPPGVGPINRSGEVGRIYISPIPATVGSPLAQYLSGNSNKPDAESYDLLADRWPSRAVAHATGATDLIRTVKVRAEQRFLRTHLFENYGSQCAICGRILPQNLLVAAHIKPRAECTETERLDFSAAAMIACTLGCDTLFEFGYVTVDETGLVRARPTGGFPGLSSSLTRRDGLQCLAFSETTAENFEFHCRWHASGK